jgi:signal transduction histidine kinase/ActR/RegA family two-component response regulator
MLDLLFGLPARVWGLLALVVLAPPVGGLVWLVMTRNRTVGIAGRLAGRAVVVMALGLGVLATVATVALVRTGLQEIQRRHVPAVVELASRLGGGHQHNPIDMAFDRELALFRAVQPDARAAIAWGSSCRAHCLAVAADPGALAHVRAWAVHEMDHPPDARGLHTMTLDGEMQLIVPAAMRDSTGLPTGHVVVMMRAGWVANRALQTATLLLAIAYGALAAVWWLTRRTVAAMVARRVKVIANRVRAAEAGDMLVDSPHPDVRDELSVLDRAVHANIVESVARLREADRRTADARALAARMEATATLAAGVAHDFNNLMTGVMANAELLKLDLGENQEARGTAATIIECAHRGGQLAQQLLAFARGGRYQPVAVDLNALVRESVHVEAHSVTPDIEVRTDLEADLMRIEADPVQLGQVVANLHRNAIEALAGIGGGRITIATRNLPPGESRPPALADLPDGAYVELSVIDSGPGMNADTRERIFEPFFTTKQGGRGMGLAATYGIVTHHGGQIEVQSEPARGTAFRVYLPATGDAPAPAQSATATASPAPRTILFVDDETAILSATRRLLEAYGYRVLIADTGAAGITIARRATAPIDAVLLDMRMPGMSGVDAFGPLRDAQPDARVIICSGYELDAAARDLLDRGAVAVVRKPFRIDDLVATIERACAEPAPS